MKKISVSLSILLLLGVSVVFSSAARTLLTEEDILQITGKLQAFEKGAITLEELTEPGGQVWGGKLLGYYLSHTNTVTTKSKVAFSRCYAAAEMYPEAVKLAQEYVSVYSNDWHGWKIIGGANYLMNNFEAAIAAYTNAVRLGDDKSCPPLGLAALKVGRLDVVHDMMPHLLFLKKSKQTEPIQVLKIATVMMIYSFKTDQKEIFISAVDGLIPKDILLHEDVTQLVREGCKRFNGMEIEKLCEQMEK